LYLINETNGFMKRYVQATTLTLAVLLIFFLSIFPACRKSTAGSEVARGFNVNIVRDIKYGSNENWLGNTEDLYLDVYMPVTQDPKQTYPLVLFVHGGGFQTGDKAPASTYMKAFAASGYVGAAINYRLGWTNDNPSDCSGDTTEQKEAAYRAIQDTKAALRFMVANAEKYHIDTNHIFLSGASAGAVTVLNAQFLTQAQYNSIIPGAAVKLGGVDNADNALTNTYTIKGICGVSGCVVDSDVVNSSNAVPLILFHGGQDEAVPPGHGYAHGCPNMLMVDGSVSVYNRMAALGKPCVLHFDPLQGHIPFTDEFRFNNTLCFFNGILNEQVETGLYQGNESSCP